MHEIMEKTKVNGKNCITFTPRSHENAYIQFITGSGCHTPIGFRQNHRDDVTLGHGCLRHGTIMHEILHSLGFWHEQSRADRDQYVAINYTNIQHGHEGNFRKYTLGREIDHLGTPYDYGSVMHYSAYSFAIDRHVPTIRVLQPGAQIGQRTQLSDQDAEEIKILYGCIPRPDTHHLSATNPPAHTNAPSHTNAPTHAPVITHVTSAPHHITNAATTCPFEHSLCGWTQSHTDTLDWSYNKGSTHSSHTGPHADHSNNATAGYLYLEASNHFNKNAVLVSPTYNSGHWCFRGYYNSNGANAGYLRFSMVHGSRKTVMRTFTGNHGDVWHHFGFSLRIDGSTPFHFEVEGHTGSGFKSDIAIDDFSITPGYCTH